MTTAHRATWKAARGGLQEEGSFRLHAPSAAVSGKDAPTERNLKKRHFTLDDASRDEMRVQIEDGAEKLSKRPRRSRFGPTPEVDATANEGDGGGTPKLLPPPRDAALDTGDGKENSKRERGAVDNPGVSATPEGEEPDHVREEKESEEPQDDSGDESDESDEDEAELLAELERIRKEREFERAKKQAEDQERLEREETTKAASENPLLSNLANFNDEISETASIATGSVPAFAVRRRWDDDVVFRNQARGERKQRPRFLNDTIRNDFHRRFMRQYMR